MNKGRDACRWGLKSGTFTEDLLEWEAFSSALQRNMPQESKSQSYCRTSTRPVLDMKSLHEWSLRSGRLSAVVEWKRLQVMSSPV